MGYNQQATAAGSPIFNANKLKLGIFGINGKGTANTLAPGQHQPTWAENLRAARLADGMGLEAIVAYSRWKGHEVGKPDHPSGVVLDPFTWAAGIAQATEHAAVFATTHAATYHPITVAKQCATIDVISGGRFGLNVVAGWNRPELEMFGAPLKEHEERYKHLTEWMEIVLRLWSEAEEFDFAGEFFTIRHGGSRPQPLQKPHPPIMNAGSSGPGMDFAIRLADMCFVQISSEDPAKRRAQVSAYKDAARERYGREVQVWIMASLVQRATSAEAEAFLHYYAVEQADNETIDGWLAHQMADSKSTSRPDMDALRLRVAAGAGGSLIIGDADQVTDQLQAFSDCGVDGLLLSWMDFGDGLVRLRDDVLPRLEARGLRTPFAARRREAPVSEGLVEA